LADTEKKPAQSLEGLLCPNTLRSAFREAHNPDLPAREGLKELLGSKRNSISSEKNPEAEEFSKLERCQDLLVEEFLTRKQELLRLNRERKNQILDFFQKRIQKEISLEDAVFSRIGSPEHEALLLFAHQASLFQLLQTLLIKKWNDKNLLSPSKNDGKDQTINWQIISFLKKNSPKGIIQRHDWSFLKLNLYSWFSPSAEVKERLRLLLEGSNFQGQDGEYLVGFVRFLGSRNRLSQVGIHPNLVSSKLTWKILLAFKNFHEGKESGPLLSPESTGSILVSGLKNGETLNALRDLSENNMLQGVWAFTDSDFERYLSEIIILWESASEIPQMNIHPRAALRDISKDALRAVPLFQNGQKTPQSAQFGGCFHQANGEELKDVPVLLDQIREGGLLVVSSETYWPTDSDTLSDNLRESILRKANVRFMLDLRQLHGLNQERVPKSIVLLEKSNSKEIRDSNRPQIVKIRGQASAEHLQIVWSQVLDLFQKDLVPGEVFAKSLSENTENIKIESMSAAAAQIELRSKPWITLTDPFFYESSSRLRRHPNKAYALGTLIKWNQKNGVASPRGIFLKEEENRLNAYMDNSKIEKIDASMFFFIPESSLLEKPDFFRSQILSAPIQFWFRLELEQSIGKRVKKLERISEQRLKLMPLTRLFEAGALLPVSSGPKRTFESLETTKRRLSHLFQQPNLSTLDRMEIHDCILALENSIQKGIDLCVEYAKFLFPHFTIHRENLPLKLPEISPTVVLDIFRHLDQMPMQQHPSIHITRFKSAHDFKVTNVQYEETPTGSLGELKIFQGMDAILKISGPTLLLRAAHEEMLKKTGRSWKELSDKIFFPTDFLMIQTQIREILKSIEDQVKQTRDMIRVVDQIFCCLLGLANRFEDEKSLISMKRHLNPEDQPIQIQPVAQKVSFSSAIDLEAPTEILQ
jgi:hypothetical protein